MPYKNYTDEELYDEILGFIRRNPTAFISTITYGFGITEDRARKIINQIIYDGGLIE